MKLLVLGGTQFLGRHIVEEALRRGHEVTLFHRGRTNPDLFPEAEHVHGDRNTDLGKLAGRKWDALIDTSAYIPQQVQAVVDHLRDAIDHYTFISTISVYRDFAQEGIDEDYPLADLAPEGLAGINSMEGVTGETYGGLKVACERTAEAGLPGRVLVIRPGLIVGPYDPTDRFTYWVGRAAEGGEMLAPEPRNSPIQFIDGRDLATWTVTMVEAKQLGTYLATGPDVQVSWEDFLNTCREAGDPRTILTWVDANFLLAQEVRPWRDLPLWLPPEGDSRHVHSINISKAIRAGLKFRSGVEIVRDTLEWHRTRPADYQLRSGLSREKEQDVLANWHQR